ncbi:MAG: hypothetical protein ACTSQJ_00500 [Promethearchaeota archaeon]
MVNIIIESTKAKIKNKDKSKVKKIEEIISENPLLLNAFYLVLAYLKRDPLIYTKKCNSINFIVNFKGYTAEELKLDIEERYKKLKEILNEI